MNEVIQISANIVDGREVQTVDARDLHGFLSVAKDFSNWIKQQISRAHLVENKDYFVFVAQKGEKGRPFREYKLTIESGKHIAMMSGVPKGRDVRDYFIECERRALAPKVSVPSVRDPRTQALIESLVRFDAIEQEQQRQADEMAKVQEAVAVIEARTQPENKHFTVMGYSNLAGLKLDLPSASRLGRQCANLSREQGLIIGSVNDPRFGRVHTYHESVLKMVVGVE